MEIADFLLARYAEDEEVARAAAGDLLADEQDGISRAWFCTYDAMNIWPSHLAHLSRHDPARVLAKCAADRRIVAWHRLIDGLDTEDNPVRGCCNCIASGAEAPYLIAGPCMTVRLLATPYADHEDYREDWKP